MTSKKQLTEVRLEYGRIPKGDKNRFPVIVQTELFANGKVKKLKKMGVQYWTPKMVANGTSINTDKTISHFVDYYYQ